MSTKPALPLTAVLEMTYRCNHACLFCSCPWFADNFDVREEIGVGEWKAVIDELFARNIGDMAFTGGEPLLKDGLFDIIGHAVGLGVSTHLLSNGRIMSDDVLRFCAEHKVQLSLSLPGLDTFQEHTGSDTNPHDVLEWLRKSHESGIATVAGITVTNRNLGELFETVAEALLAGADSILLNRFMPGGRGLQHRDMELNTEQLNEMLDTVEDVLRTANRFGHVGTELPLCVIDPAKYENLKVGTRCSAAVGFFVIDPSGWVRVCNHSEHRLLHWRELDQAT
ncbi:MAG: radical SAM protein, partial [Planctomycetaceae bacterium]|nr:radical SAM protein [Planctomycetaceae bacterium]